MTASHGEQVTAELQAFYGAAASGVPTSGSCPGGVCFGVGSYGDETLLKLPEQAIAASMGCGNPFAVVEVREGDVVLDLGSGGGIDVLLSARRAGHTGRAYGLDMTPEMLELARRNAEEAGVHNVEFLEGRLEAIPLPDASVDVVISNCVIALSPDKAKVFAEIARVLRPAGRVGVTDVVAGDEVAAAPGASAEWSACAAGALSRAEYELGLRGVGFTDVVVNVTHPVGYGLHSATIGARKRSFEAELDGVGSVPPHGRGSSGAG